MRSITAKKAAVVAIVAALALAAAASAFWTGSGSGQATLAVGTPQNMEFSPGAPVGQLYPGGSAGIELSVANPNLYPVQVASLMLDTTLGQGGISVDPAHAGCASSAIHFTPQSNGGLGWLVPAGSGTFPGLASISIPGALTMSTSASDACQGAMLTLHLLGGN
jgi:hypothetical protein